MRKKLVLITNDELVKESNYADLLDVFGDIIPWNGILSPGA